MYTAQANLKALLTSLTELKHTNISKLWCNNKSLGFKIIISSCALGTQAFHQVRCNRSIKNGNVVYAVCTLWYHEIRTETVLLREFQTTSEMNLIFRVLTLCLIKAKLQDDCLLLKRKRTSPTSSRAQPGKWTRCTSREYQFHQPTL